MSDAKQSGQKYQLRQHAMVAWFGELALKWDALTDACFHAGRAVGTDLANVVELHPEGQRLQIRSGVRWKAGVVGKRA